MKIRLAKKIKKELHLMFNTKERSLYWAIRWFEYDEQGGKRDYRITKAILLTKKWNKHKLWNDTKKMVNKHPFKLKELLRSVEKLKSYKVNGD